jgi:hypothetical protein
MGLLADSSLTKDDSESSTNKVKNKRGRLNSLVQNKPSDTTQQLKEEQVYFKLQNQREIDIWNLSRDQALEEVEKLIEEIGVYSESARYFKQELKSKIKEINK